MGPKKKGGKKIWIGETYNYPRERRGQENFEGQTFRYKKRNPKERKGGLLPKRKLKGEKEKKKKKKCLCSSREIEKERIPAIRRIKEAFHKGMGIQRYS